VLLFVSYNKSLTDDSEDFSISAARHGG